MPRACVQVAKPILAELYPYRLVCVQVGRPIMVELYPYWALSVQGIVHMHRFKRFQELGGGGVDGRASAVHPTLRRTTTAPASKPEYLVVKFQFRR
jgi:hypothetical protein